MANTHRIHLVPPSQPQPESLDAQDIASQALTIARECSRAISALSEQHARQLADLELLTLRAMAQRARRS